jgi:hypothetical protein
MYQPSGFTDSSNIVIINRVPYFRYTGLSYKDKLKNGLSLEFVFQQEDNSMMVLDNDEKVQLDEIKEKVRLEEFDDYEDNSGFYEQKENKVLPISRKGKNVVCKTNRDTFFKKKTTKQNGYSDKLFVIDQHLGPIINLKNCCEMCCFEVCCCDCRIDKDEYEYEDEDEDDYLWSGARTYTYECIWDEW